jgi:hypothetical protein
LIIFALHASIMAWRFDPLPDINTIILSTIINM